MDNAGNEVYRGLGFLSLYGDQCLIIFLTYDIKNCYLLSVIPFNFDILRFNFDILRHITTFFELHSVFFGVVQK